MNWNKLIVFLIPFCLIQSVNCQKSDKKSGETVTVTGKVVGGDNMPISGAVIYVDNIRTSNVTKNDGSFKIKISSSAYNIEVRSSEHGQFKTPINGQTSFRFYLDGEKSRIMQAEEPDISETFDSDGNKDKPKAKKMNTYNNIYQMIRVEVPGVVVSGSSLQIQQGHSFFGTGAPLLVVNGVIVPSIDNINPVEVKSIKVLTGSAAAIYGVKGSNGVIDITLLNGTENNK